MPEIKLYYTDVYLKSDNTHRLADGAKVHLERAPRVLKPSEACELMKLGAKDTIQCRGEYAIATSGLAVNSILGLQQLGVDQIKETCAIGALAVGIILSGMSVTDVTLPVNVGNAIVCKNDKDHQTREQIADSLMEMEWT